MKASTGRESKVKHSTGEDYLKWMKDHHRRRGPRTSTGEQASITHFTGRLFNLKRDEQEQDRIEAEEAAMAEEAMRQAARIA